MQTLDIMICESSDVAPDYKKTDFKVATLDKAVIVKGGTDCGNPTVDLQFSTDGGASYVAMVTGKLIQWMAAAITGAATVAPEPELDPIVEQANAIENGDEVVELNIRDLLDAAVDQVFSDKASAVNNTGIEAQLRLLKSSGVDMDALISQAKA